MNRQRHLRRWLPWIRDVVLFLLLEPGYWSVFLLALLVSGLRFVLKLPIDALDVILVALTRLYVRLAAAKINLLCRDDEPTRQRLLADLAEKFGDEPESAA